MRSNHEGEAAQTAGGGATWGIPPADEAPGLRQPADNPFATPRSERLLALRGLVLGAVAAVIAAGLWATLVAVTNFQVGLVAVGVALLVAGAVRFGSGGLASTPVRVGSVGLTVVAMTVAEFLIVRHFVNEELAAEGVTQAVPLLINPVDMLLVVTESLRLDPLTLVFWAIAVFAAWRFSAPSEG